MSNDSKVFNNDWQNLLHSGIQAYANTVNAKAQYELGNRTQSNYEAMTRMNQEKQAYDMNREKGLDADNRRTALLTMAFNTNSALANLSNQRNMDIQQLNNANRRIAAFNAKRKANVPLTDTELKEEDFYKSQLSALGTDENAIRDKYARLAGGMQSSFKAAGYADDDPMAKSIAAVLLDFGIK